MKNAWIAQLKSEAELYLENLSQFEAEYYGEAFQTKKQELEGQVKIFSEKLEKIVNTTGKELADVQFLKEQREKEKKQLKEQIDHSEKHIEKYERDYKERERKRKASITRLKNLIEKNHGYIKEHKKEINPLLFWKKYENEKNAITSCERQIKDCEAELAAIPAEPETNQGPALKEKRSFLKENLSNLENELKKLEKQEITIKKELDSEYDELFRNFLDTAQVISYRDAVDTVRKKFQKIGFLNPCLQYAKEHYSALYFFFRLAGETLFSDESDAFSLENSPSIPCKLCSEKLVEKMQSAPIKMQGLKQSVSFRTQREFLMNPKTSSNLADSTKRSISDQDPLLRKALEIVIAEGKATTSLLQRELSIGYAYAAKLIDLMAEMNAVGPFAGASPREVLWTKMDLMEQPMDEEEDLELEPIFSEVIEDSDSFTKEFVGEHFKKETVLEMLDLIETLSDDGDLPELFERFAGEVLSKDSKAKELFEEFKRLYRETPEQILVTEQRYFMEKQLEEQREANEKLLEEQREANRILEEAERQRAREEAYRAEEEQEHNRRMEIYQAKEQCSRCAKRRNCVYAGWKERLCNDFVPR